MSFSRFTRGNVWVSISTAIILLLFAASTAHAATKTWDGGGGDTNMSTAANWDADTLPSAGDILWFDGTSTNNAVWDSSFPSANNWELMLADGYTGTVTISSSTVTITSSTVTDGMLNIGSNSLYITDDLEITGGTVTSTWGAGLLDITDTMRMGGTGSIITPPLTTNVGRWVMLSGTVTTANSDHPWTLTFDSGFDDNFTPADSGVTYYNVVVNTPGKTLTTGSTDFVLLGDLTITAGTLAIGSGTMTVQGDMANNGGVVTQASGGYIIHAAESAYISQTDGGSALVQLEYRTTPTYVHFIVEDQDENTNSSNKQSIDVTITTKLGENAQLTLNETGNATGIFSSGAIPVQNVPVADTTNSYVDIYGNDTITMTYVDPEDSSDSARGTVFILAPVSSNVNVKPTGVVLSINNGSAQTTEHTVQVTLGGTSVAQYLLSEDPQFTGEIWKAVSSSVSFVLSPGLGVKTLYAKYATTQGFESEIVSSSIKVVAADSSEPSEDQGQKDEADSDQEPVGDTPEEKLPYEPGVLLKAKGNDTVYYYGNDGKRHAFPHISVFMSWGFSFDDVVEISTSELSAIQLGANMVIKPGTRLVKITTDPKVYAVGADGTLHWVKTEAIAKSLYGKNWNSLIVDVSDALFVNYERGSEINSATYPDGAVVRYNGKVYFVQDGTWRMFAGEEAQKMNNVLETYIHTPEGLVTFTEGSEIAGEEAMIRYIAKRTF